MISTDIPCLFSDSYALNHHSGYLNPLNTELSPICRFLALLEAHHIFHVNRIRVKVAVSLNTHVLNLKFF
jgi:hypothetical protein